MIPDCYDPIEQERSRDLAWTARITQRPRCQGCGGYLTGESCLDLTPFGIQAYACDRCVQAHSLDPYDLDDE